MMDELTVRKMVDRLVRTFADWLGNRTVEQYYTAETAAKLLEVSERTFNSYVQLYETSCGKDGIGPKYVLSFKAVRFSATSINRFMKTHAVVVQPGTLERVDQHQQLDVAI